MSQRQSESAADASLVERILSDGDVEAIAEATAARLAEIVSAAPGSFALVDARQLARDLGVSLDYVYAHATELGAMRLGTGPKARIRFDLDRARQALETRVARSTGRRRR
jgi:fumarylacetoacetate (FAA) hydrolase family protein